MIHAWQTENITIIKYKNDKDHWILKGWEVGCKEDEWEVAADSIFALIFDKNT